MSKIYNIYLDLKQKHPSDNTLYLFKSGIFFIFIDEDALIASNILGLKLGKLNDTIFKCGFPISSLEKYTKLLQNTKYHLEIIDTNSLSTHTSTDYIYNDEIKKIINNVLSIDVNTLSISETYDFLYNLQKDLEKFSQK